MSYIEESKAMIPNMTDRDIHMEPDERIEVFERHAIDYDGWFEAHPVLYRSELEILRRFIPEDGDALEVGVGTGRFAAPLRIGLGVEPAAEMAVIAKSRGIDVIRALAEALPFAAGSFDLVLMVTVVCFLEDIRPAFAEAYRVLRPGGAIVIGFIEEDSPFGRDYLKRREQSRFLRHATFLSRSDVIQALNATGFTALSSGSLEFGFVVLRAEKPL